MTTLAGLGQANAAVTAAVQPLARPQTGDMVCVPDRVLARLDGGQMVALTKQGSEWTMRGLSVHMELHAAETGEELPVGVTCSLDNLTHLHLRWNLRLDARALFLGDAWERAYGDLEWRGYVAQRVMPWYFQRMSSGRFYGYGVRTQPKAMCFWQCDADGVSLWLDLRSGGNPARLQGRQLQACSVVMWTASAGEPGDGKAHAFCKRLCASPRLPAQPIFGSNDWNYAYGKNTAEGILRDADLMLSVTPGGAHKPFVVADDGWQDRTRFPSLPELAAQIRSRGATPGIWIRPLLAAPASDKRLMLPAARLGRASTDDGTVFDPSNPEGLHQALQTVRNAKSWGFSFLKHDFSSFDLLGRFGSDMGASPARPGWSLYDRTLTTAEVISAFYQGIRREAGDDTVILGCNTFGHLAAGIFDLQRIADDTSGQEWERTRLFGVNGLAHRIAQHRAFYHADPDIVAITEGIPWAKTREWMDVVARSGTSLFFAPDPKALSAEARTAMRGAIEQVLAGSSGYPIQPELSTTPEQWTFQRGTTRMQQNYDWNEAAGVPPRLQV